MASNILSRRYFAKGRISRATKAQLAGPQRAAATTVSNDDISIGQIFWNPKVNHGEMTIFCVRDNHCGGRPMDPGAYGHPVLIVGWKSNGDDSKMGETQKSLLALGLTSFGKLSLPEWILSGRGECMNALPILDMDSAVLKTNKVPSNQGWIKLDGYTLLWFQSGALPKQSYVLVDHVYALSASQLAPFRNLSDNDTIVRLSEISYLKVMRTLGMMPESYNRDCGSSEYKNGTEGQMNTKQEQLEEAQGIPERTSPPNVECAEETHQDEQATAALAVTTGAATETISALSQVHEYHASLSTSQSSVRPNDDTLEQIKHRLEHLNRRGRDNDWELPDRKRRKLTGQRSRSDLHHTAPARHRIASRVVYWSSYDSLPWKRQCWVPENCWETLADLWERSSMSNPNEKEASHESTTLVLAGSEKRKVQLPREPSCHVSSPMSEPSPDSRSAVEIKSFPGSTTESPEKEPLFVEASVPISRSPSYPKVQLTAPHPDIILIGSDQRGFLFPSSPEASANHRQHHSRWPQIDHRQALQSPQFPGNFMSFEASMEEFGNIQTHLQDMGLQSKLCGGGITSVLRAPVQLSPQPQSVLESRKQSPVALAPPQQRGQYTEGEWELVLAVVVAVSLVYTYATVLVYLVPSTSNEME